MPENFIFPASKGIFEGISYYFKNFEDSNLNFHLASSSLNSTKFTPSTEIIISSSLKIPSKTLETKPKTKKKDGIDWIRKICFNPNVNKVMALRFMTRVYKEAVYCKYYVNIALNEKMPENKWVTLPSAGKSKFYC